METARVAAATLLFITAGGVRADWPQFMGPTRDGIAAAKGLARSWPKTGPRELWSVKLGPGFGGTAVEGGRVYLLDRVDREHDAVRCLRLADGKEVWRFVYAGPDLRRTNGPRCTPAVDREFVFTIGIFGHLQCVRKADGKPVWNVNLVTDFGGMQPAWGVSQSALMHGKLLIAAPQGGEAGVVAFEKATGKVVWKSPPICTKGRAVLAEPGIGKVGFEMSYSSPFLTSIDGVQQVVVLSHDRVVGVDPRNGTVLWTYQPWRAKRNIPAPTPVGDGRLFVTCGYGAGSVMIQARRTGQASRRDVPVGAGPWQVRELLRTKEVGAQCQQPLLHEGALYIGNNSNSRRDGLTCMDLNGLVKWKTKRAPSFGRGPLILADGMIYAMDGAKGVLHLVDPSPDGYKELAQARIFQTKPIWGAMSLSADGKLLLRDKEQLKCLDVKNP